jgi:hypothetical protein
VSNLAPRPALVRAGREAGSLPGGHAPRCGGITLPHLLDLLGGVDFGHDATSLTEPAQSAATASNAVTGRPMTTSAADGKQPMQRWLT